MGFLDIIVFGVHLWVLIVFSLFGMLYIMMFVYAWMKREWIKGVFFRKYFPERVVKVVIHHRSNIYRIFWRLIPYDKMFKIKKVIYHYDDQNVNREKEFFVMETDKSSKYPKIQVDGKDYNFDEVCSIKLDKKKYIEIHYWFNNPSPIDFNFDKGKMDLTSTQLKQFKDNDLFAKLLTLEGEKSILYIVIIISIIILIMNIIMLLKEFGIIDKFAGA